MPTASTPAPRYGVHHVQLARAAFATIAALMITFSRDHSASVGLSVFSGFAIATGLIWGLAAWLVFSAGQRMMPILMGAVSILAGMTASIVTLRSVTLFFVITIVWLLITGVIEAVAGARARRAARALDAAARSEARDALTLGVITVLFGLGMLFVPWDYSLEYTVPGAPTLFILTGIIIGVGVFGAYAAVVAVYLAIAGFSPRRAEPPHAVVAPGVAAPGVAAPAVTAGVDTPRAEESA